MAFEILPLSPLGAEIRGLTLAADLSDADFEALRGAVLEHGLVRLRDQTLDDEQQVALGRRFGPLEELSATPEGELALITVISNLDAEGEVLGDDHGIMRSIAINEQWHTDSSFRETPATYSIFRAVVVPPEGGETWYASLRAGWEALDSATRSELLGLRAVHDYRLAFRKTGAPAGGDEEPLRATHPLVRRHPETGARGLYLSGHASEIEGMEPAAGRALIEKLLDHCTEEGRVYRHRWRVGDVLIWDNRCMLHRAQGFDARHPRVMHHVRVAGREPVVS